MQIAVPRVSTTHKNGWRDVVYQSSTMSRKHTRLDFNTSPHWVLHSPFANLYATIDSKRKKAHVLTLQSSLLARFLNRLPFILQWLVNHLIYGKATLWPGWILPQKIVVKRFPPEGYKSDEIPAYQLRDYELQAYNDLHELQGRVIPRCYGSVQMQSETGIILEWIPGETLLDWFKRQPKQQGNEQHKLDRSQLSKEDLEWLNAIYSKAKVAVSEISKYFIHGDIHFENILIGPDTRVIIIDFENSIPETMASEEDDALERNNIDLDRMFAELLSN
ncbi:hypothetical protein VE03_10115 [Pseudogymnoascus sp. 23342-1-I1]|nr:hypothetical protein VE03_10115 [Pseudogymnoascus sp. 23342-1-I1]